MPDSFVHRARRAASILLQGERTVPERAAIPPLTQDEITEARSFFPMPKFFILGHARSGTTLLARLIRLHPEVHCNWQAHFFTRPPQLASLVKPVEIEEWLAHPANRWNRGQDPSPVVMRAVADFILERDARRNGKRVVGDKSPTSTLHGQVVRDMHAIYADASIVYIVRDGRDVLVSQRFRNFVEEKNLTAEDRQVVEAMRRDRNQFTNGSRSIFTEAFIRRHAQSWVSDLTEIEAEGRRLYGRQYISLRYEDLLRKPFDVMCKLWQFLGVDANDDLEALVAAAMGSNPDEEWQAQRDESIASFLPKGQAGNWRLLFNPRDKAIFKEIAGDSLVNWGYETDFNW
jgi:LPS sulfotransferase NodH